MTLSSASCGRYIIGLTYSRPLLRPRWCTRTSGAPSKGLPTRPPFARNSATTLVFQSVTCGILMLLRGVRDLPQRRERLAPRDDLVKEGVERLELVGSGVQRREVLEVGERRQGDVGATGCHLQFA